ncbi:MAG: hypothetical protein JRH01_23095 [Deltaproteobacteria bacterium]|nr:hypothetical protein [Deltaproteobacteria bacterium]MBW2394459.1 hypothetical protein [Deltaproteobacteria bacterium]
MSRPALEQAKAAWASAYEGLAQAEIDQRVRGFSALVRGIAATGAVTPEAFASGTSLNMAEASGLFSSLAAFGLERDDEGRIIGAALTTRPTPHVVAIHKKRLFAWCALDTLFIPGLLGERAEIESTCPVSKAPIRLTVDPEGVNTVSPPEAALSIVLPGFDSSEMTTGPASPT